MPKATPLAPGTPRSRAARGSRSAVTTRLAKRDKWLSQIDPQHHFNALFELLSPVQFFAKNRRGETMYSSNGILRLYGIRDESEIVGLTDFDLNPATMAEAYVQDDEQIYATGQPLLDKVELWFDAQGLPDWFLVNKLPVRSRSGKIIGIMGLLRPFSGNAGLPPEHQAVAPVVSFIRQNFHRRLEIADLARIIGISPRQLQRRFATMLGLSPQELVMKTRVLAASRALRESDRSIVEIASECGFYDQSSFTEHFRRYMGQTPLRFRRAPRLPRSAA